MGVRIDSENPRKLIINKSYDVTIDENIYIWSLYKKGTTEKWQWTSITTTESSGQYTAELVAPESYGNSIWVNKFLKIYKKTGGVKIPVYIYTGTSSSGHYDYLLTNGNPDGNFLISSDAPFFVHTFCTKVPYEECKKWSAAQWMMLGEETSNQAVINSDSDTSNDVQISNTNGATITACAFVSTGSHDLQSYWSGHNSGYCYVVLAHYANEANLGSYATPVYYKKDGNILKSQIIQY